MPSLLSDDTLRRIIPDGPHTVWGYLVREQYPAWAAAEQYAALETDFLSEASSPRRARPRSRRSKVQQRGVAAGLTHWQVSHGCSPHLGALVWLDNLFTAWRWQVPAGGEVPLGRWPLEVPDRGCHVVPTRFLLQLLGAANREPDRIRFGLLLLTDGEPAASVLDQVRVAKKERSQRALCQLAAWAKSHQLWLGGWSAKARLWLARQPKALRWALLHSTPSNSRPKCLANLNWGAYRQARTAGKARRSYLPASGLWEDLMGCAPTGLTLPCMRGFKAGALATLCAEFGVSVLRPHESPVQGWLQAFVQLVRLFGDYQSIRRFVTQAHTWSLQGLHDAGQFRLPGSTEKWTPAAWAALCLKHPQAVTYGQTFARLEQQGGVPASWSDLRRRQAHAAYPGGAAWAALKLICSELQMSERESQTLSG